MTKKRNLKQIVTELDDSKFKELPRNRNDAIQQLYENLWSMFDLPYDKETRIELLKASSREFGLSVNNYAWTKEVEDSFENHPFHKKFIENNSQSYNWFRVDAYPASYNDEYMEIST